jgi:hypothetical protein
MRSPGPKIVLEEEDKMRHTRFHTYFADAPQRLPLFFAVISSFAAQFIASPCVAEEKSIESMYRRIATDLAAEKPLVATVYVALCDNDHQGIAPVKNKKICRGDDPDNNLYWASSGGLFGHMRTRHWKRLSVEDNPTPDIAVKAVWTKRFIASGLLSKMGIKGPIEVIVVGLAYRGDRIRQTMVDYLKAVNQDNAETLTLPDGRTVEAYGKSHVVGWIGHDYFMDEPDIPKLIQETRGDSSIDKGVFGLSCMSDYFFRPAVERTNVHILALNTQLTFPSAFTVLGILGGIAAGKDHRGIHQEAVKAFAEGQKRPADILMRVFSYGDHK